MRPSSIPFLRTLNAVSELPAELSRLRDLANNVWWCWQPEAMALFKGMDPDLWEECGHNPIAMVESTPPNRLRDLASDVTFVTRLKKICEDFDSYMAQPLVTDTLEDGTTVVSPERPIAYFSTEYGLHESLQLYSGGLGVLSGDHLKSSSDERLPLIGVGLFYLNGYFQQTVDKSGHQNPQYPENQPACLPLEAMLDDKGDPLMISLPLGSRTLYARIWKLQVGRVPLYLMDTNVSKNSDDDRRITARLYEADRDVRMRQEILLGIGGVRMLAALGITPSVWHMNEGHSAFLVLERLRQHMTGDDLTLDEAKTLVRSSCVFTTHTPVDAGNERFSVDLMSRYFQPYAEMLGLEWADWHGDRLELRRAINCYGETTTGKNDNARRVVYLSSLARQVLEDQYRITGPKGSVFCISNLQHYHSRWKRYCKVNGLPDIAPYEIRHTFVSISDALPEAQMKKLVGHSQSMDTYGVYGHEVQGEGEEISRNLDAIFSKILSAT